MQMKFRYEIAFPADSVWGIVGDFNRVDWLGGVEGPPVTFEQGTEITRTFNFEHFNAPSAHRLDRCDNRRRYLSFTAIETPHSILLNATTTLHIAATPANTSVLYVSVVLPKMHESYRDDIYHSAREWGEACTRRIENILSDRNQKGVTGGSPGAD